MYFACLPHLRLPRGLPPRPPPGARGASPRELRLLSPEPGRERVGLPVPRASRPLSFFAGPRPACPPSARPRP